jgi:hypothetical protein
MSLTSLIADQRGIITFGSTGSKELVTAERLVREKSESQNN